MTASQGLRYSFEDSWLIDGLRTPFVDYTGAFAKISPIDLGIKAAREVVARAGVDPADIGTTIAGSMAQASFDAYMTPRHIGIYAGVPVERPAHLVQRICGTGIEAIVQGAEFVTSGKVDLALCVGAESMSRNPVAAYTHRTGFRLGQIEFKDFLWEALLDPACSCTMGDTAENLARDYQITREEVDRYAERSFARAVAARETGFFDDEIVRVSSETFVQEGFNARSIRLPRKVESVGEDSHVRLSPYEVLAKIKPAFGGVQTGGNSSAVVDGAAAVLVGNRKSAERAGVKPLARIVAAATVGVPPHIMGIGPVPAIRAVLEEAALTLDQIDRIEINEAFAAQVMACIRELDLDDARVNVNGGAIAIGHPLGATGVRITATVARELKRSGLRFGIASACVGGGQGIAILVENADAVN
ncbi:MAG: thiolase family protein [Rhizobiaceae bacterium]|nr:thiolase family protein [Rhizobiaceae bacterium]